ncbi:MAG: phosphotransferase [Acidobacteriota bacterium]
MSTPSPLRSAFAERHPDVPLLSLEDPSLTKKTLRDVGWLTPNETVCKIGRPGEGNMNLTLRVTTDRRSLIVKQSRPWVEKYDVIEAPFDRMLSELAFYEAVRDLGPVARRMPRLLGAHSDYRLLLLEDLGAGADLSVLYASQEELAEADARSLGEYLRALHEGTTEVELDNRAMRELNAAHIFDIPLQSDNGVAVEELEPGLESKAAELRANSRLAESLGRLKARYLAPGRGSALLQGDFFPGSWLRLADGELAVIDPEFAFSGDVEFDVGVAVAHLCMAGQPRAVIDALVAGRGDSVDFELVAGYAGAEVVRRLLGVAQLPLPPSTGQRARLLDRAAEALADGRLDALLDPAT